MQQLREVAPSEIDERYTDEARRFITAYLSQADPTIILKTEINVIRNFRIQQAKSSYANIKFENLDLKELFVKSERDNYEIPVTAYIPKGVSSNSPIVVFFHGGGWTFCSRETHHLAVANFADTSKCIWLSVEYRLSPEFKHPIGLEDCLSVFKWVANNKTTEFNANKDALVGVCGDSAGGNYSATAAHELKSLVNFQILIYPCVEIKELSNSEKEFTRNCYILIPEVVDFFKKNLINNDNDAVDPRASPIRYSDFKGLAKCIIIAAELDPIVDHSRMYHDKLIENNNSSELHVVKGVPHGYINQCLSMPNAFEETKGLIVGFLNSLS